MLANKKEQIRTLANLGIDASMSPKDKAQLRVLNSFVLLSCFFTPFFIVAFFIFGYWQSALVFCAILIWLIIILWFQSKKRIAVFKTLLLCCIGTALPAITLSLGIESGFWIYYCLFPVIAFNTFELNDTRKWIYFFVFLALLILINQLVTLAPSYPWIELSLAEIGVLYRLNLILCIIFISVLMLSVVRTESELHRELESTIAEKNVLLAEVHHRVKNNLAVISSMLRLQIKESNNVELNNVLQNNSNRIHSMSLTHNKLYVQDEISKIAFDKYLEDLAKQLIHSYDGILNIKLNLDLSSVVISLNDASVIGLIVNEIITNSIKHAFIKDSPAIIDIKLNTDSVNHHLLIGDNGKGFVASEVDSNESLGLMLIDSLTTQLDGTYQILNKQGTKYIITFPNRVN